MGVREGTMGVAHDNIVIFISYLVSLLPHMIKRWQGVRVCKRGGWRERVRERDTETQRHREGGRERERERERERRRERRTRGFGRALFGVL